MRRSLLALCAAVTILAGACGSTHKTSAPPTTPVATAPIPSSTTRPPSTTPPSSADPTTTTTVAPTTTTTVPDTSVVPRRITVAYVDAVLAKLNHVYGDAVRSLVANGKITRPVLADIAAIYSGGLNPIEVRIFAGASKPTIDSLKQHPGDRVMHVRRLIAGSPSCIFARVSVDESAVARHPAVEPSHIYEGMKSTNVGAHRNPLNPTPWVFFYDLTTSSKHSPGDPCG